MCIRDRSYATGFLAREWNKNGHRTITQKFIQTGNVGHSEDIDLHRQIMGIPFTKEAVSYTHLIGTSFVGKNYNYHRNNFSVDNGFGTLQIYAGFNFNTRKEYRKKK